MLEYKINSVDNGLEIVIKGRVDSEGISGFQQCLTDSLEKPEEKAVIDLSELKFINSSGIGKLLIFYKKFTNTGRELQIKGIDDDVYTLFKAIRLDKLINIEK